MNRVTVLNDLEKSGVIAVVRANSVDKALKISRAIVKGGIEALEITFTIPGAEKVIIQLKDEYRDQNVIVGAGTVLDPITARAAIMAGAAYIVSPTFNKETAKICNLYQIPYIPGCLSVGEIQEALTYGTDIIKLFPGNVFGPSFIKSVKGPLPHVNIMPSGGVSLDNIKEWIDAGAVAVSVGGNLTRGAETGDYDNITELAKQYQQVYIAEKRGNEV
ncbi:KHG/KDPG aldolase [Paraliobacillus ryukyuensis]|uniref:2-keto-3-deoxy-phosphogluconate aldolase n=1 Tax=Paraliobacillus ryukyuensis TaxID=200904 RepID=A0A366EBZ8_9BACI|nr:bifunctional 2-keto-4-hydroxyglutarate aldolase/2-keto-3-deoxy-6-phosphogluconate aldolase [Paraliobacillus ryukyuensis]RBO99852.1 2-keto-3-deoxy-phosphogluconate aldolase [Paraliobacillus ryukyuensis]